MMMRMRMRTLKPNQLKHKWRWCEGYQVSAWRWGQDSTSYTSLFRFQSSPPSEAASEVRHVVNLMINWLSFVDLSLCNQLLWCVVLSVLIVRGLWQEWHKGTVRRCSWRWLKTDETAMCQLRHPLVVFSDVVTFPLLPSTTYDMNAALFTMCDAMLKDHFNPHSERG